MPEIRRQRFQRLAEKRVNRILNDIRLLGNLANRSSYDYSEKDTQKIYGAVEEAIKHSKSKFSYIAKIKFRL